MNDYKRLDEKDFNLRKFVDGYHCFYSERKSVSNVELVDDVTIFNSFEVLGED